MVNYACKTIRSFSRSVADKGKVSEEVQWQKHPQLPGLSLYRFTHILLSLFLLLFLLSGKDIVSLPQSWPFPLLFWIPFLPMYQFNYFLSCLSSSFPSTLDLSPLAHKHVYASPMFKTKLSSTYYSLAAICFAQARPDLKHESTPAVSFLSLSSLCWLITWFLSLPFHWHGSPEGHQCPLWC